MTDPTTLEVATAAMNEEWRKPEHQDFGPTNERLAAAVIAALNLDPTAPASLLKWHATTEEREHCAAIAWREHDAAMAYVNCEALGSVVVASDDAIRHAQAVMAARIARKIERGARCL